MEKSSNTENGSNVKNILAGQHCKVGNGQLEVTQSGFLIGENSASSDNWQTLAQNRAFATVSE